MPRKSRYADVLTGIKGREEVRIKKGQKIEHERRYIYGQAERLGIRVSVHKEGSNLLAIIPSEKNGGGKKQAGKKPKKRAKK